MACHSDYCAGIQVFLPKLYRAAPARVKKNGVAIFRPERHPRIVVLFDHTLNLTLSINGKDAGVLIEPPIERHAAVSRPTQSTDPRTAIQVCQLLQIGTILVR